MKKYEITITDGKVKAEQKETKELFWLKDSKTRRSEKRQTVAFEIVNVVRSSSKSNYQVES